MPAGALLGLGCATGWGVSNFLAGIQSRRLPALSVVIVSEILSTPVLVGLLALQGERPPIDGILWGALAGSFGIVALTAFYRAMALGLLSVVAPISAAGAVVPVAFGIIRGEVPTATEFLGIAIALTGVVLVSTVGESSPGTPSTVGDGPGSPRARQRSGRQAIFLAVAAALGFGFFFVVTDIGTSVTEGSPLWVLGGARAGSLIVLVGLAVARRDALVWPGRRVGVILLLGLMDTAATALFTLASTYGQIGVVSVLASLYPVVTVVLARITLDERICGVQAVGAALTMLGVVLLAAG
jgi:drug/metabolite transporter (DMT)-like permease